MHARTENPCRQEIPRGQPAAPANTAPRSTYKNSDNHSEQRAEPFDGGPRWDVHETLVALAVAAMFCREMRWLLGICLRHDG
jgi:hypothetical protein